MNKKKQIKMAKLLFKASLKGEFLDNSRALEIAKSIASSKLVGKVGLLKAFKRFVAVQIAKEEIIVETSTKTSLAPKFEKLLLAKFSAKKVKFLQDEKIVLGARVTAGDWIFDSTLDNKLKQLTS